MYLENIITNTAEEQSINNEKEIDNEYNKLHFYFDEEEHETIEDINELEKAIDTIPKQEVNQGKSRGISTYSFRNRNQKSKELTITVEFESDFMETENDKVSVDPNTGDNSSLGLWLVLLIGSGLTVVGFWKKKKYIVEE